MKSIVVGVKMGEILEDGRAHPPLKVSKEERERILRRAEERGSILYEGATDALNDVYTWRQEGETELEVYGYSANQCVFGWVLGALGWGYRVYVPLGYIIPIPGRDFKLEAQPELSKHNRYYSGEFLVFEPIKEK